MNKKLLITLGGASIAIVVMFFSGCERNRYVRKDHKLGNLYLNMMDSINIQKNKVNIL